MQQYLLALRHNLLLQVHPPALHDHREIRGDGDRTPSVLSISPSIVLQGNKELLADLRDQGDDVHVAIGGFDADLGDSGGDRVVLMLAVELDRQRG